jgi:hypothetical protein
MPAIGHMPPPYWPAFALSDGAVYMIRPEGGRTAETTFLPLADHPHPTPTVMEN